MRKKIVFVIATFVCEVVFTNSIVKAIDCTGGVWAADFDGDCQVQMDDYSQLAGNWLVVNGALDPPEVLEAVQDGSAILIEAEDCIITSGGAGRYNLNLGGGWIDDSVSYWNEYTGGGYTRINVATDPAGSHFSATGTVKFSFPDPIPDGTYWLKIRWGLGSWSSYEAYFKLGNSGSSFLMENNGVVNAEGRHYFFTTIDGDAVSGAPYNGTYEGVDYLAGPDGGFPFDVPSVPSHDIATSVVMANVGAGEFSVSLTDLSEAGYDMIWVDYFELIPISGETYVIEAENCIGSGLCDVDTFKDFEYFGTSGHAVIARDVSHQYATGAGHMAFPFAIADGEYMLKMTWAVDSWDGYYGYVAMENFGSGLLVENEALTENGWHLFYTRDPNEVYTTGWSGWMTDDIAGPDGMFFDDMGQTIGNSITVSGMGPGDLAIGLNETSPYNYDVFRVDKFELIPVVPQERPIKIEAEDCLLSGYAVDMGTGYVEVARDPNTGANQGETGDGIFGFPRSIPDGDYVLEMRYRGVSWGESQIAYYKIEAFGDASIVENGIVKQSQLHGWAIDGNDVQWTSWWDDELAGPDSYANTSMSESGYGILPTTPAAEYITLSGVDANELFITITDTAQGSYDRIHIDYFRLIPFGDFFGDLDKSGDVGVVDFALFVEQWLNCNDPGDPTCNDVPACPAKSGLGVYEYDAYVPAGPVTIDGNLNDWPAFDYTEPFWCTSQWIAMDKLYYVDNEARWIDTPHMCLMYDAASDVVYGAVVVEEYGAQYGWLDWAKQDNIEIYIRGDSALADPYNPFDTWDIGQQFMVGLNGDESTTYKLWANGDNFVVNDPGLEAVVTRTVDPGDPYHHTVVYEFKIIPYDNYGDWNSSTTVQSDLYVGKKFRFDVIVDNFSPDEGLGEAFSMHCANTLTGKAYSVNQYSTVTCK